MLNNQKAISIQNASKFLGERPTIVICPEDSEWEKALTAYEKGQWPTSDLQWKNGVFLITECRQNDLVR